jgi:hypothetical protein
LALFRHEHRRPHIATLHGKDGLVAFPPFCGRPYDECAVRFFAFRPLATPPSVDTNAEQFRKLAFPTYSTSATVVLRKQTSTRLTLDMPIRERESVLATVWDKAAIRLLYRIGIALEVGHRC